MVIKMNWKENEFKVQSYKDLIARGFTVPKFKEKNSKRVFDIDGRHPLHKEHFKFVK
jgi:hypothetical protein